MKQIYFFLSFSIFNLSNGQIVNPTSATTTFSSAFGTMLNSCYDGTGLETFPSLTSNHVGTTPVDSFVANEIIGTIDFNLGGNFDIDGLAFWNQNEGGPDSNIGVNTVEFYSSTDGITYNLITGAPTSFSQITIQPAPPELFSFTAISTSYIRMNILSNHGGANTGFAEIAFATGGILNTESFLSNRSVKIFPNPSSDYIQITNLKTTENYFLYNNLGQEIKQGIISNDQKIDIQILQKGLFFLKIGEGNLLKFVKE